MECIITTEATCDLPKDVANKYDIKIIDMQYCVGSDSYSTSDSTLTSSNIYHRMRNGEKTSTSQINEYTYEEFFTEQLKNNVPILHIGFSSGLSGTSEVAKKVIAELNEKNTNKIYMLDSLSGSVGQGMVCVIAREVLNECDTLESAIKIIEQRIVKLNSIFTIENLKYLSDGGRIKAATAIIGNILSIKPIIKADMSGKLMQYKKVISRKKSLLTLIEEVKTKRAKEHNVCFVAHADSLPDAEFVKEEIQKQTQMQVQLFEIGTVMGSHCGPGTIAVFFEGNER